MRFEFELPPQIPSEFNSKKCEIWSTSNKVLPFGARGSGNYESPCI